MAISAATELWILAVMLVIGYSLSTRLPTVLDAQRCRNRGNSLVPVPEAGGDGTFNPANVKILGLARAQPEVVRDRIVLHRYLNRAFPEISKDIGLKGFGPVHFEDTTGTPLARQPDLKSFAANHHWFKRK